MNKKRTYEDGCGIAHGLDLIGDRWAILVVRELLLGPRRFTDLRTGLPTISPNVLTQRLEELENRSVVGRRRLPPPAATWVYELTDWGQELKPIMIALGNWAVRSPAMPRDKPISASSLVLALETNADVSGATKGSLTIGLSLAGEDLLASVTDAG